MCNLADILGQESHLVPWVEYNRANKESVIEGLLEWRKITHHAMISCDPSGVEDMTEIMQRAEFIDIIPGLKTSPVLGHNGFDSIEGWKKIAENVKRLREITGCKAFIFEHETAIKSYKDGLTTIGPNFETCLKLLPQDINYIWYPSASMSGAILDRYLTLADRVQKTLSSVIFVDHATFFSPREYGKQSTIDCTNALTKVIGNKKVDLIYTCGDTFWPHTRVPEVAKWSQNDWVIVYPGHTRWVEAAKATVKAIKEPEIIITNERRNMRFVHIHSTWAEWWILPNLLASGLKPCEGFHLMGTLDSMGHVAQVQPRLEALGFKVIPGVVAFSPNTNKDVSEWFNLERWQKVATAIANLPSTDVAIDFEPYWDTGVRYPSSSDVRRLALVTGILQRVVLSRKKRLHLLPGIHYPFVHSISSVTRAFPDAEENVFKFVDCDESTYKFGDKTTRPEDWQQILSDNRRGTAYMGYKYRPGFYFKGMLDAELQTWLDRTAQDSWYYMNGEEAKTFGTHVYQ